jgi:hypothetical protein
MLPQFINVRQFIDIGILLTWELHRLTTAVGSVGLAAQLKRPSSLEIHACGTGNDMVSFRPGQFAPQCVCYTESAEVLYHIECGSER